MNQSLPDVASIRNVELKIPLRVYSADRLLISEFGNERRKPVAAEDIPQGLIDAVLASEDSNFYRHQGIDVFGLARALIANLRSNDKGQGASTITMQVARNFFLTPEKTYTRKLKEVLLSIKLEQILSKDEILALYINKIFLGHRAYGFGAAADVYYGKQLNELSLAETAMLAGLPKAPSTSNPLRNPERAVTRRNYVLGRLLTLGKIDEQQYALASAAPVTASKRARKVDLAAPYIAEMVRLQLIEALGENAYWAGLNVYTTIDSTQQTAAQRALRAGLQAYDKRHGFRGAVAQLELPGNLAAGDDPNATENSLAEHYEQLLSDFPNSHEQIPALITATEVETAIAQTSEHGEIKLHLKDAAWAKRHRTANIVGSSPESMADLLAVGDVVYVQSTGLTDGEGEGIGEGEEKQPNGWRLSQLPNVSGALISMHPDSGRVLALVGGYDFFLNKYNRATQAIRQPGSNIKPFIYSAALDKNFTPASLISGAPIVMTDPTHGTLWRPENYSGKFFGPTRIREALQKSLNLVSIRLLRAIGIPYAREYLERFGIDMRRFSPTLTMALGAGGITPLELLSAYATLANSGYKVNPYFIDYVTDRTGRIVYRSPQAEPCDACFNQFLPAAELFEDFYTADADASFENNLETNNDDDVLVESEAVAEDSLLNEEDTSAPLTENDLESTETTEELEEELQDVPVTTYQAPRVMSLVNNYQTVSMLKDVVRYGTGRKALVLDRPDLAGKTGTTNEYVDAWFSGFNSQLAATVWVGFDDPKSMGRGEAGSVAALPIWVDFMRTAMQGVPADADQVPDYIKVVWVNKISGELTSESDPNAIQEYFPLVQPDTSANDGPYGIEDIYLDLEGDLIEEELDVMDEDDIATSLLDDFINQNFETPDSLEPSTEDAELESNQPKGPRIIENDEDTEGLF